jgi:hypothetical protein
VTRSFGTASVGEFREFQRDKGSIRITHNSCNRYAVLHLTRSSEIIDIIDINNLLEDRWPEICMCAILMTISLPV